MSMCRCCGPAFAGFGLRCSIAKRSGRCRGSRSRDGEVTTELAKRIFAFRCSAVPSSASSTVFEGRVVLAVVVAMGMYRMRSGLPHPSSSPTEMDSAAARAS